MILIITISKDEEVIKSTAKYFPAFFFGKEDSSFRLNQIIFFIVFSLLQNIFLNMKYILMNDEMLLFVKISIYET